MKIKTNKILGLLMGTSMAIVLFLPSHALAQAFGISPPSIENENLKIGSNLVYTVNLSANDLQEDMKVHSEFEGDPEIEQWFTIQNRESLVMKAGQSILPVSLLLKAPKEVGVSQYEGNLKFSLSPQGDLDEGVSLLLGGRVSIKLNVINHDVTDYWVQSISVDPIAEGQPIDLNMTIKNLGNTNVDSVLTKISAFDKKTDEKVFSDSAEALSRSIEPNSKVSTELTFLAPDLGAGDYWLDVEAFKEGKSTYENRLSFNVESVAINNSLKTAVQVTDGSLLAATSEVSKSNKGPNVKTTVRVRAPYTEKLIMVGIAMLFVLTIIVAKIYVNSRKKRR